MARYMTISYLVIIITCSLHISNVSCFLMIIILNVLLVFLNDQICLFSIFTVGNIEKACQAAASYLLFFPNDETMIDNKNFYMTLGNVNEGMFVPRAEALHYHERELGEKALLQFIEDSFQFDEGEILEATGPDFVSSNMDLAAVPTDLITENEIPGSTWLIRFFMTNAPNINILVMFSLQKSLKHSYRCTSL